MNSIIVRKNVSVKGLFANLHKRQKRYVEKKKEVTVDWAEAISSLRTQLDLTQEDFGAVIGRSLRNIQDWEKGNTAPKPHMVQLIVHTFGLIPEWALGRHEGDIFIPSSIWGMRAKLIKIVNAKASELGVALTRAQRMKKVDEYLEKIQKGESTIEQISLPGGMEKSA